MLIKYNKVPNAVFSVLLDYWLDSKFKLIIEQRFSLGMFFILNIQSPKCLKHTLIFPHSLNLIHNKVPRL